jgi:hypothetical protein
LYTGGGATPLLVFTVTTDPGISSPAGVVPTTESFLAVLFTCAGSSGTLKPASRRRLMAASSFIPTTAGTSTGGAPLT